MNKNKIINNLKKYNITKVSNYIMNIGIALSLYSGYKIYESRQGLPEGACPIADNNFLIYTTISILIISLILTLIGEALDKKLK